MVEKNWEEGDHGLSLKYIHSFVHHIKPYDSWPLVTPVVGFGTSQL
jgi:hypothetical protein